MADKTKTESVFKVKLRNYIKAGYSYLLVETHEEYRAMLEITSLVKDMNKSLSGDKAITLAIWDCVSGVETWHPSKSAVSRDEGITDPKDALTAMCSLSGSAVLVFKDLHQHMDNGAVLIRMMRHVIGRLEQKGQTIVLLSPSFPLPGDLEREVQTLPYTLPIPEELTAVFNSLIKTNVTSQPAYEGLVLPEEYVLSVAEAAVGLTMSEAENAMSMALAVENAKKGKLVFGPEFVKSVFEEKIIALKSGFLEYVPAPMGFDAIGGLSNLKKWVTSRRMGFDQVARDAHLDYPKGLLVTGVPGCGKTMLAMATAAAWGFPLFKLDLGKLFGGIVGKTEANTRELIRLLEGIGRAVILIDELDKSLNTNATSGAGDSGTSSRMFGTFLSWLSSKTVPVFLIGTMNNIETVPPELLRPGRFDATFFVDLPNKTERLSIFNALLEHRFKHPFRVSATDDYLLNSSDQFTGAEIEAAISSALYHRLSLDGKLNLASFKHDLEVVLEASSPQAKTEPSKLQRMRDRAKNGFVMANESEATVEEVSGRRVSLN